MGGATLKILLYFLIMFIYYIEAQFPILCTWKRRSLKLLHCIQLYHVTGFHFCRLFGVHFGRFLSQKVKVLHLWGKRSPGTGILCEKGQNGVDFSCPSLWFFSILTVSVPFFWRLIIDKVIFECNWAQFILFGL